MKIKFIRNTLVDGEHFDAERLATLPDDVAQFLIGHGKAVEAKPAKKAAPKADAPKDDPKEDAIGDGKAVEAKPAE